MPSFSALPEPLTDGVVSLRLSAERDIPEVLIAYQDDPGLPHALGEARAPSGAALGRRAEEAEAKLLAGQRLTLTILEPGSDTCRGEVRVLDVDWEQRAAALRVWLSPALRGRGLGRRAHALALRWLQETFGLQGSCGQAA